MKIVKEKFYKIPLFYPYVSERAIKEVVKVLKTKFIGQGPKIPEFEQKFARKFKTKYAVAVNSGTAALHLAYILAGVKRGDEVVGPLFTCSATWHPVLQLGAKPVFADIKDDFTINPVDLERKITRKTKAIVVMHYGGCLADMGKIMKIAEKHNLPVIEDTAQALGAKYKGKYAGTIGDYGCFSFQAIKYMTTIDGGMLVMKKKEDYEKAKRIRWFGIDRDLKIKKDWQQFKDWERREMTFDVWEIGYKYHMNNFNAVMGLVHMQELDKILAYQRNLNKLYRKLFKNVKGIKFLPEKPSDTNWLMTVLVDKRDDFARKLKNAGIETNTVHIRNDVYKIFKPYAKGLFPNMDRVELKYLCLPIHFKIKPSDVKKICNIVKSGW